MKYFLKIFFIILIILGGAVGLQADDVTLIAEVSQRQVPVNSSLRFTLTITGKQFVNPIQLPEIDGFESRYIGPASRISIINGKSSTSTSFNYTLYTLREGTFTIPALSVTIDGQTYTTRPIEIEVTSGQSKALPAGPPTSQSLKDKIFVVMSSGKSEAYIGEKIPLTVKMYVSGVRISDIQYPDVPHAGFDMDEYAQPKKYEQIIGGIRYTVLEFRTFIAPTRNGSLSLGPAKISGQVLERQQHSTKSRLDQFDSIFKNDDLFSDFFDYYTKTEVTLESADLQINVLPLPEEGKPDGYSGAVGEYDFEVTVSPKEVKVGDPITLRAKVRGAHLKGFDLPSLMDSAEFKTYEPIIKEERGEKILEQVVIPTNENIKQVPSLSFSYFDPEVRQYKILSQGPFPITVSALGEGEDFKVVGLDTTLQPTAQEVIGRDIIFIKNQPGDFHPIGYFLYRDVRYWAAVLVCVVIWLGAFGWYRYTDRIKKDVGYARKLFAPRKAKAGIKKAQHCIACGKADEFYSVVFQTLKEYVGDRFHHSSGGLTFQEINGLFSSHDVAKEIQSKTKNVLDACDMVRYASAKPEASAMQEILHSLQEIIDYLERHK